jgi:hypothetical protein
MVRLTRPGGWVASMEYDMEHALCYPPHPAFARLCEIFTAAFARHGADQNIGRRIAELFRSAGLTDVAVEARAPVYPVGHSRRTIRADLVRSMRPHVLRLGLASEAELDELDAAARAHLTDPGTITISALLFLVRAANQPDRRRHDRVGAHRVKGGRYGMDCRLGSAVGRCDQGW